MMSKRDWKRSRSPGRARFAGTRRGPRHDAAPAGGPDQRWTRLPSRSPASSPDHRGTSARSSVSRRRAGRLNVNALSRSPRPAPGAAARDRLLVYGTADRRIDALRRLTDDVSLPHGFEPQERAADDQWTGGGPNWYVASPLLRAGASGVSVGGQDIPSPGCSAPGSALCSGGSRCLPRCPTRSKSILRDTSGESSAAALVLLSKGSQEGG